MSRMQPISPITPDVPQMVQAGGQQGNVRNQQGIQQAQIAQRGQIAQQQQQIQREQLDAQQQAAMGNRAVQLAGVYEQSRSQSEYRDLLRDKAQIEQGLKRDEMSQAAKMHQEEMDLKTGVEKRRIQLELAKAKSMHAMLTSEGEAELRFQDEMKVLSDQANAMDIQLADATILHQGEERDFNDAKNRMREGLDKTISGFSQQIDDARLHVAGEMTDAGFTADLKGILGRDVTAQESIENGIRNFSYSVGTVLGLGTGVFDSEIIDPRVGATLEFMGENTPMGTVAAPFYDPEDYQVKTPARILEGHVARTVADAVPGITPEQRGTVESLLSAGMERAEMLGSEEKVMELRRDIIEGLEKAGVGNSLVVFEALRSAAITAKRNTTSYRSLAMPNDVTELSDYGEIMEVPVFDSEGNVTGTSQMRADQAFLNSRIYRTESTRGLNLLASGGPNFSDLTSLRDSLSAESGLNSDQLMSLLDQDKSGFGGELRDPLNQFIASEDRMEDLARQMQRFALDERIGGQQATGRRTSAGVRSGMRSSEAMIKALEEMLDF